MDRTSYAVATHRHAHHLFLVILVCACADPTAQDGPQTKQDADPGDAATEEACETSAQAGTRRPQRPANLCDRRRREIAITDSAGELVDGLRLGDLDGDGVEEIIVHDCGEGSCVLRGGDAEALDDPASAVANGMAYPVISGSPVGDLDGDGLQDVATIEGAEDGTWLRVEYGGWPWTGAGVDIHLAPLRNEAVYGFLSWGVRGVGDLDRRGSADLLVSWTFYGESGGTGLGLVHGEDLTDGEWPAAGGPDVSLGVDYFLTGTEAGDFNDDGALDLVLGLYPDPIGPPGGGIGILWGPLHAGVRDVDRLDPEWNGRRPDPPNSCAPIDTWLPAESSPVFAIGDFDGDGVDDLVLIDAPRLRILYGGPRLPDLVEGGVAPREHVYEFDPPPIIDQDGERYRDLGLVSVPACPSRGEPARAYFRLPDGTRAIITTDDGIALGQDLTPEELEAEQDERCDCPQLSAQ